VSAAAYDVLVLGSGPAGQKAAVQAAKAGRRVAIVERGQAAGGECVHRGTIPSKTLRETALALTGFRRRGGDLLAAQVPEDVKVASLMARLDEVVRGHQRYIADQLARNGIALVHGHARFVSPHEVEVIAPGGVRRRLRGEVIVIATGSTPRTPPEVPVDHENVLDSDSILSLLYLPRSLVVLGSGVIASEYASIFAALGVRVTMIDRYERPLGFLDPELTDRFLAAFARAGGRFLGGTTVEAVITDGVQVTARLGGGEAIVADKLLCALGRVAVLDGLDLGAAGLAADARGLLAVDEHCRTAVPHIYAAGDVIGPPALATSAMEQGRRAMCHALGRDPGDAAAALPIGVYTIPEMASVGLDEARVRAGAGAALVGRARFSEIARGHVANSPEGFLKLVADAESLRVLGVQIIGESATELVHVGQMALIIGAPVEIFVENVFNFPTFAEAYRVAALDVLGQRERLGPPATARRAAG
jgi:NAD(P) transhydrogenase